MTSQPQSPEMSKRLQELEAYLRSGYEKVILELREKIKSRQAQSAQSPPTNTPPEASETPSDRPPSTE